MVGELANAFVEGREAMGRPWGEPAAELEAILGAHLDAGRGAWPEVPVAAGRFARHLAERLPAAAGAAELRALRAADLYLAIACADGDAAAIACFERTYLGEVDVAAARLRCPPALADDVKQMLRRTLFVAEGDRPAATGRFAGRGDLRGWVRVSAVRELQRLLIKGKRDVPIDDDRMVDALAPPHDPELSIIRERYRRELTESLAAAMAASPRRDRTLFRFQALDGLTLDAIAALYGVHRATVSRWLGRAREGVLERTRQELARRLAIDPAEVESIIRLVQSRLELSVGRLLDERDDVPRTDDRRGTSR